MVLRVMLAAVNNFQRLVDIETFGWDPQRPLILFYHHERFELVTAPSTNRIQSQSIQGSQENTFQMAITTPASPSFRPVWSVATANAGGLGSPPGIRPAAICSAAHAFNTVPFGSMLLARHRCTGGTSQMRKFKHV